MQIGTMARKLTQTFKFAARTAPELYESVNAFVTKVAVSEEVKFRNRKLGVEAVVNAVLLDFMTKPETERVAILARAVPSFEHLLEDALPTPGHLPDFFSGTRNNLKIDESAEPPAPKKTPRTKQRG